MKETNGHGLIREDFPGGWANDTINKFDASGRSADENEIVEFIQKLSALRHNEPAIQNGQLIQFVPIDGVYVYFRKSEDKTYMVVSNCTSKEIELDLARFAECIQNSKIGTNLNGEKVVLDKELRLPAFSIQILELE
jgi:glycosidase